MHDALCAEMPGKIFMTRDVVDVCQKDVTYSAEPFNACQQLRVKAGDVDQHITFGSGDEITRRTESRFIGKAAEVDILFQTYRKSSQHLTRKCFFLVVPDGMHRAGVQCLQCAPALTFVGWLFCDICVVCRIAKDIRCVRVAGAAIDTAIINEKVA